MGELLLVCSLITLILVVYFIYIKEREEKNIQLAKKAQAIYNYKDKNPRWSKYDERTGNEFNNSFSSNNFGRSEKYLKFLKFKNTPPPQDLKPKKLKYENYNNLQILENYYNYNQKHLNVLTPTPFKHDQVLAGNIQIQNKIQNVFQINNNTNFNCKEGRDYLHNQKFQTKEGYISKYPVEISYKKKQINTNKYDLLDERVPSIAVANNMPGNDFPKKNFNTSSSFGQTYMNIPSNNYNYINPNIPINNNKSFPYNNLNPNTHHNPYNYNMNKVSYKVINAEDFLKKKNSLVENTTEKNRSISPLGVFNYYNQRIPQKIKKELNIPPENIHKNITNINYNNNRPDLQNRNYQNKEQIRSEVNIEREEELIPRKLRFSDSSFNKFNLVTNRKDDEWFSPIN